MNSLARPDRSPTKTRSASEGVEYSGASTLTPSLAHKNPKRQRRGQGRRTAVFGTPARPSAQVLKLRHSAAERRQKVAGGESPRNWSSKLHPEPRRGDRNRSAQFCRPYGASATYLPFFPGAYAPGYLLSSLWDCRIAQLQKAPTRESIRNRQFDPDPFAGASGFMCGCED